LLAVLEHTQGETLLPEEIAAYVEAFLDALPALHNPGCSRGLKPPLSSSDLAM